MKTLYIECAMGCAGDMLTAALFELLSEEQKAAFLEKMNGLGLPGVHVAAEPAVTCGIAGTHMAVTVHGQEEGNHDDHHHDHDHHDHSDHHHDHHEHDHGHEHTVPHLHVHDHIHDHEHDHVHDHDHGHDHPHEHEHGHEHHHHHASPDHIRGLIDGMDLPEEVKVRARGVYDAIALAEAKAHGCPVGEVHYHEVGALDAVADVVGACYALRLLSPDRIVASPVHVGSGTVRCAHGVMPVPAPATANLLTGVPTYGGEVFGELCTPTGAALLVTFAQSFGPMPALAADKVGCGVGRKVFDRPNCVRAFLGESGDGANGAISELVCNIDDMTPEALAYACEKLLSEGALDVYTLPGTMKKGRSGHLLTVLCDPSHEARMARAVLTHTTTIGLRVRRCEKYFLTPGAATVSTPYGEIDVKTAEGFGLSKVKPEHASVAAAAQAHGVPYQTVWQAALDK